MRVSMFTPFDLAAVGPAGTAAWVPLTPQGAAVTSALRVHDRMWQLL